MIETQFIKDTFLDYFVQKGHLLLPDRGLIPHGDDQTALFINSGVHANKRYIFGETEAPSPMLTSNQSCLRTIDIDRVGSNNRTLTFFYMLGSWSIGSYWKEGAIELAHELLTQKYKLNQEDFAITVFAGNELIPPDEESAKVWEKLGIKRGQIYFRPASDNLWSMADTGPCGPCTEVFIDRGAAYGENATPGDESPRFIEIWNAGVFTEFYRNADGTLNNLDPRCIDTGAGLERLATVLLNRLSVYDIEPLSQIRELVRSTLPDVTKESDRAMNILADHTRSAMHIMSYGVIPSNKAQGYVLRRIVRRAVHNAQRMGINDYSAFAKDCATILSSELMPNSAERIIPVLSAEATMYLHTLERGRKQVERHLRRNQALTGKDAFMLFETHGIPLELIQDLAAETGIQIDTLEFERESQRHKEVSRQNLEDKFK